MVGLKYLHLIVMLILMLSCKSNQLSKKEGKFRSREVIVTDSFLLQELTVALDTLNNYYSEKEEPMFILSITKYLYDQKKFLFSFYVNGKSVNESINNIFYPISDSTYYSFHLCEIGEQVVYFAIDKEGIDEYATIFSFLEKEKKNEKLI